MLTPADARMKVFYEPPYFAGIIEMIIEIRVLDLAPEYGGEQKQRKRKDYYRLHSSLFSVFS
jgi:hypothetical protein